jgi:flagellar biosynthetic protein FlhB
MSEQRTEQPTQQRLRKAREKGQFPAAREFVGALQFFIIVLLVGRCAEGWFESAQQGFRSLLLLAFRREWATTDFIHIVRTTLASTFVPVAASAGIIVGLTLAVQLGTTNMGFSLNRLVPDINRFNPMAKLKDIPKQNVPAGIQAVLLLIVLGWATWSIAGEHLPMLMALPLAPVQTGISQIMTAADQILWRTAFILVLFGTVEMFRQRMMYSSSLRMTKQEVRQESKDSDGDPHVKARIRRLRRDLLRRRMMQDVPTATAVIVNPTHYAVAIRYESGAMASPKVVAKGRNYLALRIKEIAIDNSVTIVENPPLARALYGSVDVGGEIPPDFYRAVAEVLAYVYKVAGIRTVSG